MVPGALATAQNQPADTSKIAVPKRNPVEHADCFHLLRSGCSNISTMAKGMDQAVFGCSEVSVVVAALKFNHFLTAARNLLLLASPLDASPKSVSDCE